MILVPAKWQRDALHPAKWRLYVGSTVISVVWREEDGEWLSFSGFASHPSAAAAKRAVEAALKARTK